MDVLRQSILAQEDIIASKSRFGLFSQLPPLAIGENKQYYKEKPKIGSNGKPITNPPQMLAGTCRSGMTKSSYIQVPTSILQNDPYKQKHKIDSQYNKKMHTRLQFHQNQFIPASANRILDKASYRYICQNPEHIQKTIIRDETRKVKTKQRNFVTNSIRKVQSELFKPLKYMDDPYQRKSQILKKQRQLFKSKLPEFNFCPASSNGKLFSKNSDIYGLDEKTKMLIQRRKKQSKSEMSIYNHDSPFIPARKCPGDPIAKYPSHQIINNSGNTSMKTQKNSPQNKQKWIPTNSHLTRPTPSINLNPMNLKLRSYN